MNINSSSVSTLKAKFEGAFVKTESHNASQAIRKPISALGTVSNNPFIKLNMLNTSNTDSTYSSPLTSRSVSPFSTSSTRVELDYSDSDSGFSSLNSTSSSSKTRMSNAKKSDLGTFDVNSTKPAERELSAKGSETASVKKEKLIHATVEHDDRLSAILHGIKVQKRQIETLQGILHHEELEKIGLSFSLKRTNEIVAQQDKILKKQDKMVKKKNITISKLKDNLSEKEKSEAALKSKIMQIKLAHDDSNKSHQAELQSKELSATAIGDASGEICQQVIERSEQETTQLRQQLTEKEKAETKLQSELESERKRNSIKIQRLEHNQQVLMNCNNRRTLSTNIDTGELEDTQTEVKEFSERKGEPVSPASSMSPTSRFGLKSILPSSISDMLSQATFGHWFTSPPD